MPPVPSVVGPSATQFSRNSDAERTRNWYVTVPEGGAKLRNPQGSLDPTPGYKVFGTLPAGPVRGLFSMDGRMFGVGGNVLAEVFSSGAVATVGTVGSLDVNPVTFASSGTQSNQLAVSSSGQLYVLDLTTTTPSYTLTHVTGINFMQPVANVLFFDSAFLARRGGTRQFYYSALEDALTWDVLQVEEISLFADNLQQMARSHETVWMFGSQNSLPYIDTGNGDTPYAPISETVVEWGVFAPWSVASLDNTLFLLAANQNGGLQVMRINGYNFERVSTFAGDLAWGRAEGLDQAIGWAYSEAGHTFYQLNVPSMETSWTLDVATGLWCERGIWSTSRRRYYPDIPRCHTFAFGKHLVGDRQSGTIYEMGLDITTQTIAPGTGL